MEMDQSIIRLTHCEKEIFCFSVPDEYPSCGEELKGSRLQEAPVSLPSPLTNGHKSSCCLLVAPAHDNFNRFHDDDHNCFTFCLLFINGVLAAEGRSSLSRDAFTSTFILPRMRRVSKYSTLYRHIQRDKYYMTGRLPRRLSGESWLTCAAFRGQTEAAELWNCTLLYYNLAQHGPSTHSVQQQQGCRTKIHPGSDHEHAGRAGAVGDQSFHSETPDFWVKTQKSRTRSSSSPER
ncbi:MKRN2 opposite strand protein [Larimichthys crocea]|nr:MKRN2 opposite strand protein [Larimichthys crocea]